MPCFLGISGFALMLLSHSVAAFLGIESAGNFLGWPPHQHIFLIGLSLAVFSGWLLWISFRNPIPSRQVQVVFVLDLAWVLGSAAILLFEVISLAAAGRWLVAFLASAVGVFAVLQFLSLRQAQPGTGRGCVLSARDSLR
jgi:hypothetical protein